MRCVIIIISVGYGYIEGGSSGNGGIMIDWIAIVDDDIANLKVASHILSEEGIRVSCLRSGEELLEFLLTNKPNLILLDVHMPMMDGFEAIRRIRELESVRDIPVIFLTADDDTDTEVKALSVGAMDFIRKPFVSEVLLLRVRHTVELIHLQKQYHDSSYSL